MSIQKGKCVDILASQLFTIITSEKRFSTLKPICETESRRDQNCFSHLTASVDSCNVIVKDCITFWVQSHDARICFSMTISAFIAELTVLEQSSYAASRLLAKKGQELTSFQYSSLKNLFTGDYFSLIGKQEYHCTCLFETTKPNKFKKKVTKMKN